MHCFAEYLGKVNYLKHILYISCIPEVPQHLFLDSYTASLSHIQAAHLLTEAQLHLVPSI